MSDSAALWTYYNVTTAAMVSVSESGQHMQLLKQKGGVLKDSSGTVLETANLKRVDWYDGAWNGSVIDSLVRTRIVEMYSGDYLTLPMQLLTDTGQDTTFIEAHLVDATDGTVISSSGEIAIPETVEDSSFSLVLELPSNANYEEAFACTSILRGSFTRQNRVLQLEYLHEYGEAGTDKRPAIEQSKPAVEGFTVYPTLLRGGQDVSVAIEPCMAGTLGLFDVLGRAVLQRHIAASEGGRVVSISTGTIPPGVYFLVHQGNDRKRVKKIHIID